MFDNSWDWIDGYLSAIRNIASHSALANDSAHGSVAWISAVGSMLAAIGAFVAAGLTWKIAKENARSALTSEIASIVTESNNLQLEAHTRQIQSTKALHRIKMEMDSASSYAEKINALIEEYEQYSEKYAALADDCSINPQLAKSKTLPDAYAFRVLLSTLRMKMMSLDAARDALEFSYEEYIKSDQRIRASSKDS